MRWLPPVLIVAAATVVTFVVARGGDRPSPAPSPSPTATTATETPAFLTYEDDQAGFSIGYPADWQRLRNPDEQVRLLATPNGRDLMLVRAVPLGAAVSSEEDLAAVRQVTDELVTDNPGVELLTEPVQLELAGLPGWFYFYRFQDQESGQSGVHSHYFLFDDETMFVLVFQALPEERFDELAPVFDRIAESFQVAGNGS